MLISALTALLEILWIVVGARLVIDSFERLSTNVGSKGKMVIAAILVALGTSLPELFVAIMSGFEGRSEISLGNVFGANIANSSLVIGGAALMAGTLPIIGELARWEFSAAFLAGCAPLLLLLDGELSRLDGLVLIVIYLIYIKDVVHDWRHKSVGHHGVVRHGLISQLKQLHRRRFDGALVKLVMGIGLMLVSADLLIKTISRLSAGLGISEVWLGVFVVAIGTTLPELVLSVSAILKKESMLVFGNLLGSIVTNATFIVGILALIRPIHIQRQLPYAVSSLGFVGVFGIFWVLAGSRKKLERWEGAVLVGSYLMYLGLSLMLI